MTPAERKAWNAAIERAAHEADWLGWPVGSVTEIERNAPLQEVGAELAARIRSLTKPEAE